MFIMEHNMFNNYSEWLFNILFEVEKRVIISGYTDQARVFGYMSEYLLNVYIHHNRLKALKVPVLMVRDKLYYENKFVHYVKNFIIATRNNLVHRLLRPVTKYKSDFS